MAKSRAALNAPDAKRRKVSSRTTPLETRREWAIEEHQHQVTEVLERHDLKVRLLFHLEKFVSLVSFDPEVAKQDKSQVFEDYRQQYDLWSKVADDQNSNAIGRRSTRRQIRQQQKTAGVDAPEEENATTASPAPASTSTPAQPSSASSKRRESVKRERETPSSATPKGSKRRQSGRSRGKKRKLDEEEEGEEVGVVQDIERVPVGTEMENVAGDDMILAHPSHMAQKPEFGGLEMFLNSFVALDEYVSEEQRQKQVEETVVQHRRIEDGRARGVFSDKSTEEAPDLRAFKEPLKNDNTSHSYFLQHALIFSKAMAEGRRKRIGWSKKVSREVQNWHRNIYEKEERDRKENERHLKQLAKRAAQNVAKQWKIAEQVVVRRRQQALEEHQREQGKQRMNEMLENSAKLLESRIPLDEEGMERELDEDEARVEQEEHEHKHEQGSDDEDMDSDEMSEEEEEEDGHEGGNDDGDAGLSVEELRKKYSNLDNVGEEEEGEMPQESVSPPPQDPDESDQSIEMDSELDSEESEGDEDGDEEEEGEEEEEEKKDTLASLFGGKPANGHVENGETLENGKENGHQEIEEIPRNNKDQKEEEEEEEDITHTKGQTEVPFLLRGNLREYQHYGLDWLAGLYNSGTNGILADEMGLGKTIQTIALISYLACEKHIWGPHLIVVPTSVMLNWEMEFKRFAPGFKVMTYYGNPQQRKEKRRGWNKEDSWHVCITSYQLVLHDQPAFRRKKWHYMILDEAHNIKNFRSQRWQALLNFNSERRLLLTGTPLQNNLVELWSLLYFLMPSSQGTVMMPKGFANLEDWKQVFARPVDKMIEENDPDQVGENEETKQVVSKLHQILRPYLLRRLKADVEKQMPAKYEHVVYCRLSKRQRFLYDDFMSRAQTKETLASGNYLSIINCLMQLRKVCNHPDLFEVRPIVTSMACSRSVPADFTTKDLLVRKRLQDDEDSRVNLQVLGLDLTSHENWSTHEADGKLKYTAHDTMLKELQTLRFQTSNDAPPRDLLTMDGHAKYMQWIDQCLKRSRLEQTLYVNRFRATARPIYGRNVISLLQVNKPKTTLPQWDRMEVTENGLKLSHEQRETQMQPVLDKFSFVTPNVVCLDRSLLELGATHENERQYELTQHALEPYRESPLFHQSQVKLSIAFPDKALLQYDCGKLQRLAMLMRALIDEGHRALIFTQMTKMLDILEQFLNIHGWRYLRLDGATKIEQRQVLTERFNNDSRIPVFILSTRSGGLGINLTGADTVIFYDNDWNPSMDKQCQDRCHRIGQTRDVHIYRFVSEYTIESNILRKATQKQMLDNVVIQEGDFTTDYLQKLSVKDMLGDDLLGTVSSTTATAATTPAAAPSKDRVIDEKLLAQAEEDQDDANAAKEAMKEVNLDREDFEASTSNAQSSRATTRGTTAEPEPEPEPEKSKEPEGEAEAEEEEEEEEDDDGIGTIDDYMIRFIQRGDYY